VVSIKKKITVLAIDEPISIYFTEELSRIFNGLFTLEYKTPTMQSLPNTYNSDLILYTDPEILNLLSHTIKCNAPFLMMKRTITKDALQKIRSIPKGSRALVCNINQYMANETMALIFQLGITELVLYPFYEGMQEVPEVDYIITPKEYDFLPQINAEIVNIGNRVFDISNILDILSILEVDRKRADHILKNYMMKVPTFWYGAHYTVENRRVLISQWRVLMNELNRGILVTDNVEYIELANNHVSSQFGNSVSPLEGQHLGDVFTRDSNLYKILSGNKEVRDELVTYNKKEYVVSLKPVYYEGKLHGKIIFIDPYTDMVDSQQRIQNKIIYKGYYSSYVFDDLIGDSPAFIEVKNVAQKVAPSEATVILHGESGTGKELFAGAIHNSSPRKNKPFVAINCTTLPENLLESELFGYEDGAFTGARKGGKTGLFEKANGGTLFLDEIGDLPTPLQTRLLRAVEEKKIMRVGGDSIISIDVRIISATNKDLEEMVRQGEFREDLYYRLNVFQITVPPLRERPEDLEKLLNYFLTVWGLDDYTLSPHFKVFLQKYPWPGNIRELKNVLEYITTISEDEISLEYLPTHLKKKEWIIDGKINSEEMLMLELLYKLSLSNNDTGRRSLTRQFSRCYYNISEARVRELLNMLSDNGYLVKRPGRGGNQITEKGIDYCKS